IATPRHSRSNERSRAGTIMPRYNQLTKRVVPRGGSLLCHSAIQFIATYKYTNLAFAKTISGGGIMTMFKLNACSTWRAIIISIATTVSFSAFDSVQSQEFPKKEIIKIIVPYAAGGPTDTVARLLSPHMQKALNQTVIIENRTGAGSAIGARVVASSAPDGYTILLGNISTFAIAPAVMKHPG